MGPRPIAIPPGHEGPGFSRLYVEIHDGRHDVARIDEIRHALHVCKVTAAEFWGASQAVQKEINAALLPTSMALVFAFMRHRRTRTAGDLGRVPLLPDIRLSGEKLGRRPSPECDILPQCPRRKTTFGSRNG